MLRFFKAIREYFAWTDWEYIAEHTFYDDNDLPTRVERIYIQYRLRDKKPRIKKVSL